MNIFITSDIEVWPVHAGAWPAVPLRPEEHCRREIDAYYWGACAEGRFGLPYQVDMLRQHGLKGTFFVDPMFSFALGLPVLREVVDCIQSGGHRVELHLHPEWLTDPRSPSLPGFKGPMIAGYDGDAQERLLRIAHDRLREAGAAPLRSFRAGGWGASRETLRALARVGIESDASLGSCFPQSLPDLPDRELAQQPFQLDGVIEVPLTRFDDRASRGGRPLSLVGVSFDEMRHVLECLHAKRCTSAVIVLHGNEFVKTENLWSGRAPTPRRLIVKRFERLCRYLSDHRDEFATRFVSECAPAGPQVSTGELVNSSLWRTGLRLLEQVASRWY